MEIICYGLSLCHTKGMTVLGRNPVVGWDRPEQNQAQAITDETVQSLEPLAHVGDPGGQIDPCGWAQSKHGLRPLQDAHQAFERTRIKIRMHLDPAPAR